MIVGGLNNMGFFAQAGAAKGAPTSTGEDASFEDVLGQSQKDSAALGDGQVEQSVLPSQPASPVLRGPGLNERLIAPPPTVGVGKLSDPLNKGVGDETVNALTKRVVWNDFLRKMKDELGVSAEDVLNAFSSLSDEDLAKPPEQTIDKVVMALGLDGQQAMIAKSYFSELIQKTKPNSLGEELARSERDISLTLMSQREIDRRNNDKAVDRMQDKFFMQGAFKRPVEDAPRLAVAEQVTGSPMAPARASATAVPSSTPLQVDVSEMQPVATNKPDADVDALVKKFMSGQAPSSQVSAAAQAPVPAVTPEVANAAGRQLTAPPLAQVESSLQQIFSQPDDSAGSTDEYDYMTDASYLAAPLAGEQASGLTSGPSEFQSQLTAASGPQPMAVPDLVQQARVMVHDGGGEMKVTLTPEGLGEVAMRVNVKDGKVNVQMITESDEAKRMIERQLGELKTSLANQDLMVDTIKIDTATNLGKQLEQQYNDAQRQMAQQTLEQYRQDHQGWRRSFFEVPGAKVYKDQSEAPRDVTAPSASSRRTGARRLDLVA